MTAKAGRRRAHIYYSGQVQGVGFRLMAERSAQSMGLEGFVRNLSDGRVEVVCEGAEGDIREFMKKLASVFRAYVSDVDADWGEATGGFDGFGIRFD
jgi:acylphosphatase